MIITIKKPEMDTDFLKDIIPYRCPKCGDSRKFTSLRDLKLHLNAEHAFKVGCVKPRTRTTIFDHKGHNSKKRTANKENLSRQWSSSYDSRQSLTSSESYEQDLPVIQSYREDARMLERQLESAREFERNKRSMPSMYRSHSYDPLNSTLDKLNKDVMNSRKNIWQSSDALYNAEDVINGVEIAAEERFNNQQNIIQNLVDSLQHKERLLTSANQNVEKLRSDKEKLMKEVEDLFKNADFGNKKLVEELDAKQQALNAVTNELAYLKQKTTEDLKQKDEKLQEAERCLHQLEHEQKNLENERENLIEKVQMDSGLLRKTLEMKENQVRKLNTELESIKMEQDKILSDSVELYNTANQGTTKLKDLLKQRDTQLKEAEVELRRMKELNERLVWESRQLTEQADEHSQILHQILRQKEEELASVRQELQSVMESDDPKKVNEQIQQLQEEVVEKTALLLQKESELQSLKTFLTTTAEKEAVAREKLEKFITELIERADRAEKELDALKNHFQNQKLKRSDIQKLKRDLETSMEDIDSDDEMSDDSDDVKRGSLYPTSPSPLKRQNPVVKSKNGYQGIRGMNQSANSIPYSPSICDSGYYDSKMISPRESHMSPNHRKQDPKGNGMRKKNQNNASAPRNRLDRNNEALEENLKMHLPEHNRRMSPDTFTRYVPFPTDNLSPDFDEGDIQSPSDYIPNYVGQKLSFNQANMDTEPKKITQISEDEIIYIPYNKMTGEPLEDVEHPERQQFAQDDSKYFDNERNDSLLPKNTFKCIPTQLQQVDDTTQSYSTSDYQGLPQKVQQRIQFKVQPRQTEEKQTEWSQSSSSRQVLPSRTPYELHQFSANHQFSGRNQPEWSVSSSSRQGFPGQSQPEWSHSGSVRQGLPGRNQPEWAYPSSTRQGLPGRNQQEWSNSSSARQGLPVRKVEQSACSSDRQALPRAQNKFPSSDQYELHGTGGENSLSDVLSITDETMPSENNSSFQKIMDENGIMWEADVPQNYSPRARTLPGNRRLNKSSSENEILCNTDSPGNTVSISRILPGNTGTGRFSTSEAGIMWDDNAPQNNTLRCRNLLGKNSRLNSSSDGILWDTDVPTINSRIARTLPTKNNRLGASEPMLAYRDDSDTYDKYKSTSHLLSNDRGENLDGVSRNSTYSYPRLKMSEKFKEERKQFSYNLKKIMKLPFLRESGSQVELTCDTLRAKRGEDIFEKHENYRNGTDITDSGEINLNTEAPFRNYHSELNSEPSTLESSTQTWMIDREHLDSDYKKMQKSGPESGVRSSVNATTGASQSTSYNDLSSILSTNNAIENKISSVNESSMSLECSAKRSQLNSTANSVGSSNSYPSESNMINSHRHQILNNEPARNSVSSQNLPQKNQVYKPDNLNNGRSTACKDKDNVGDTKDKKIRHDGNMPVNKEKKRDLFEELRQESFNESPDLLVPVVEPEVKKSTENLDDVWNSRGSIDRLGIVSPQRLPSDIFGSEISGCSKMYGSRNDPASDSSPGFSSNDKKNSDRKMVNQTNSVESSASNPMAGLLSQQLNDSVLNLIASTVKDAVSQITSAVKSPDSPTTTKSHDKSYDKSHDSSLTESHIYVSNEEQVTTKGMDTSSNEEMQQELPAKLPNHFEVTYCPTEEEVDSVIYDKSTESLSNKPVHGNLMSDSDGDIVEEEVFPNDEAVVAQGRRKSLSRQMSVDVHRVPEISLLDLVDESDGGTESLPMMKEECLTSEPPVIHRGQSLSPEPLGLLTNHSLSPEPHVLMIEEALTPESLDQAFFAQPETEVDDDSRHSISSLDGFSLSRSSSQDSVLSERMSTYSKRETTRKRRQALCHIFSFLDTATLIQISLVCREWKKISRHPSLWKHVILKNQKCSVEFLLNVSKWCTSMETLHLEGLMTRDKKEFETEEDYEKRTRAMLEPGLEKLLQVSESTLKTATIIHCENIITDKGLWLVSCYSRVVRKVTYICNKDLPGADVIWALGAGCRDIKYLNITLTDPSSATGVKFNNKCLQVISQFCQDLQTLCIGGTEIDINGLVLIAKSCQRLSKLELHYSSCVTEDTMVAMCRLGLQHLKQIVFHFTPVEAKAILQLCKSSKHLRKIHISLDISNFDLKGEYKEEEKMKKYADMVKHLKELEKKPGVGNILKLNCGEVFINTEKKFFGLF